MHLPEWVLGDREYLAALWILTTPALAHKGVLRHVHLDGGAVHGIDFLALMDEAKPWSDGEKLLVRAAWCLFNGGGMFYLDQAMATLSDGNLLRVLEAVFIRRPGLADFFQVDVSPARIVANLTDD